MAAPRSRPKPAPAERKAPPYYIAVRDLYVGSARAHAPGARVLPEHVERHGWHDMVRHPDDPPPQRPRRSPRPVPEPATDPGQASTTTTDSEEVT